MGLVEDIQAVRARTDLTLAEKRAQVYDLKGTALTTALAAKVGVPITRGVYVLTLTEIPQYVGNRLRLVFTLTKNGVTVPLDLPLFLVNPPILVPDGLGGFALNLQQAIRDAIIDMAH